MSKLLAALLRLIPLSLLLVLLQLDSLDEVAESERRQLGDVGRATVACGGMGKGVDAIWLRRMPPELARGRLRG